MDSLQQAIIEHTLTCLRRAENKLGKQFPDPAIRFTQRGKIAGSARMQSWEIRYNPVLLAENPQAFLAEVVPHELAHLLTFACYGKVRPHGPEWQKMMTEVFNVPARTTHSFDISSVSGRTFLYRCQCREHQLTVRRHNKILRQQAIYHCMQCHQPLTPVTGNASQRN
ncbi:SprT family zinc-dependent metalloprotease [Photobacterium halotolerans]|uniref:Protein SprT n=1 Tax=Photobacterium halotolerans TaxID=265726 RepID=A0A7X4WTC9_9GAMM|nr:SprT family zinc-dependent metalloprotease [Photobacterium halotolerans]NAW67519.1 SprT family zinc-dependent metalloprotease [Photobacterium halotolerans]NAW88359.1 SprT family zinc-dependent metalloprotease [Photobacterium halotolerans]NAX47616.1 SprT family zinc-dependent metalloprotease [Photobacterium halotolerans]